MYTQGSITITWNDMSDSAVIFYTPVNWLPNTRPQTTKTNNPYREYDSRSI